MSFRPTALARAYKVESRGAAGGEHSIKTLSLGAGSFGDFGDSARVRDMTERNQQDARLVGFFQNGLHVAAAMPHGMGMRHAGLLSVLTTVLGTAASPLATRHSPVVAA
ncbi:MAG TPA: hypothetical protein VG322_09370 [Candidatus Acidoferrales bacterium]|nr:hypothetical protein [Candidatus Acidoferrales bacterium]